MLVRPDQEADYDEDDEEHDQDDRDGHVSFHGEGWALGLMDGEEDLDKDRFWC